MADIVRTDPITGIVEKWKDMGDGSWARVKASYPVQGGAVGDKTHQDPITGIVSRWQSMGDGTYARIKTNDIPGRWIVAGNRFGTPRTQATSGAGNKMMSTRLHKSPGADMIQLAVVFNWFVTDPLLGELPPGGPCTVSAAVEFPINTTPGKSKAFQFGPAGSYTTTLTDMQILQSNINQTALPANTLFRMRAFADCPGLMVYGRNGLTTDGTSLSGFGGEVDRSSWSSTQTDKTQVSTQVGTYTGDTAYEPILVGKTLSSLDCWLLVGDSITAGLDDLILPGPSYTNAGDAYGNGGYAERACSIKSVTYINVARPSSKASGWATSSSDLRIYGYAPYCNKGVLALGRNDLGIDDAPTIIANIQAVYAKMRQNLTRVIVVTIPPATTTTDNGATLANQTVHSYEQVRQDVNAAIRAGAVCPTGDVYDHEASVRDTSTGAILWRVDGGAWSFTGLHPTTIAAIQAGSDLAAMM